jgi:hypothetical protein
MENGQKHIGKIFVPKKCSFILEHPVVVGDSSIINLELSTCCVGK